MAEVTLFLEEEKTSLIERPEDWVEKVKELGLEGQVKMLEGQPEANPIPFRRLDVVMRRVIHEVCPHTSKIEDFNKEPIPMTALGMHELAKSRGYFNQVIIHYAEGAPDPFMVGYAGEQYREEGFLMAQWGPEKFCFETLLAKARQIWIAEARVEVRKLVHKWSGILEGRGVEELADQHFAGKSVTIPSFY